MSRILVVAPHPDDETLGCGGTLRRHKHNGDAVHWIIMTGIGELQEYSKQRKKTRTEEIREVAEKYEFDSTHELNFPSSELDVIPQKDLIEGLAAIIKTVEPQVIYAPYWNDIHGDHGVTFDVVAACSKSFRYPFVKKLMVYETLSETEFSVRTASGDFKPNCWVNITDYIEEKIQIMKIYRDEMGEPPFPRSEKNIRALATLRGATVGHQAAEAFMILKEILD